MAGASGPQRFYDQLAGEYDDAILRCVPRYGEMLGAILSYLPDDLRPRRILELGPGSGHLTRAVMRAHPSASLCAIDVSRAMLHRCRGWADDAALELVQMDFANLGFAEARFDLVVSSIAIHHVDHAAKQRLYGRIHACLRPGGVFAYSDQSAGESEEIHNRHMQAWRRESAALGTTDAEWRTWMQHQDDHDHHATLRDQMRWLADAGFPSVDCVWRYALWTVLVARRAG